ncbi:hypothetical protein KSP40_PGU007724 [Platanthera guangdongensis]|uniref:Uncharacterized protein n=1 Tax=Platanthera guangdongensis TaxID=2320717 RepID=A0ABR2MD17_9ASPA
MGVLFQGSVLPDIVGWARKRRYKSFLCFPVFAPSTTSRQTPNQKWTALTPAEAAAAGERRHGHHPFARSCRWTPAASPTSHAPDASVLSASILSPIPQSAPSALTNPPPPSASIASSFPSPSPTRCCRSSASIGRRGFLVGCSADDLFSFCNSHPFAGEKMGEILEGEMCGMTLSEPKNGNARSIFASSPSPRSALASALFFRAFVFSMASPDSQQKVN